MRLLLDTHALIWWADGTIARHARMQVLDPRNSISVSAVSLYEISFKVHRGRLAVDGDLLAGIDADGFEHLPVSLAHAEVGGRLPLHHGDPFDRLLIAQAQVEGLTIVTRDRAFEHYDVDVLAC